MLTGKMLIIMILVISMMISCACCIALFVQVQSLQEEIEAATDCLEEMSALLKELSASDGIQRNEELPVMETVQEAVSDGDASVQEEGSLPEPEAAHKVYLTFDDGPSTYTDEILDILDQYDVKATFFVVGKEDAASKEALQQIVERGHSLGMHSYSHIYREIYESVDSFAEDFTKIQEYLLENAGVKSTLYRFPGGSSNRVSNLDMQEFADYLESQGVTFYDWNIVSGDGGKALLPVQDLVDNSTKDIAKWGTSIVLLHDSAEKRTTVEALPVIIENILAMEDTVILPITDETVPVQHIHKADTTVEAGNDEG